VVLRKTADRLQVLLGILFLAAASSAPLHGWEISHEESARYRLFDESGSSCNCSFESGLEQWQSEISEKMFIHEPTKRHNRLVLQSSNEHA
jgi:hypothetical protein